MRYRVRRLGNGLEVELADIGSDESRVTEAPKACRGGRCGRPGEEYLELESPWIERDEAGLKGVLRPVSRQRLHAGGMERWLACFARERNPEDR